MENGEATVMDLQQSSLGVLGWAESIGLVPHDDDDLIDLTNIDICADQPFACGSPDAPNGQGDSSSPSTSVEVEPNHDT
eukprot:9810831-Karenia_brevis.AAC.1